MKQFKSALVAFLLLGILGSSFTILPNVKNGNTHVNGGGTAIEGGVKSTFVFNAVQLPNGSVNGHLHYNIRVSNVEVDMDITCMTIDGNRATLYGTITSASGDVPYYIYVGNTASFTVEDNDNGKTADRISDLYISIPRASVSCSNNWNTYLPVSGNISINE